MTLISCEIELDSNGQYPNNSSNNTTPKDQISALDVYISYLKIYGAMYIGDPNIVWAMLTYNILQNPKSPNFTLPFLIKMLSGFKSLCMILFLFNSLNASNNCLNIIKASFSFKNFLFCNKFYKVPSLQYSYTK
jgi:hypothetical protein